MRGLPSLDQYDAWDYTGSVTVHTIDLTASTLDTLTVEYYSAEDAW